MHLECVLIRRFIMQSDRAHGLALAVRDANGQFEFDCVRLAHVVAGSLLLSLCYILLQSSSLSLALIHTLIFVV